MILSSDQVNYELIFSIEHDEGDTEQKEMGPKKGCILGEIQWF